MEHFDTTDAAEEHIFKDFEDHDNVTLEVCLPLDGSLTLDTLHDAMLAETLACCGYSETLVTVGESRTVYFFAWSWGH